MRYIKIPKPFEQVEAAVVAREAGPLDAGAFTPDAPPANLPMWDRVLIELPEGDLWGVRR